MRAANLAISSPLLEDASVAGAKGVIINVTGGPDLSLLEVSDASTIVQEAADEDANIIFGAVVDPSLKGRVKITVIATGFDPIASVRPSGSSLQTPIDLTPYAEHARTRAEAVPVASAERMASRLSISRRSLVDLPMAAAGGQAGGAGTVDSADDGDAAFDVPAFLRRQEG
jgi:cell division protein FtsZ